MRYLREVFTCGTLPQVSDVPHRQAEAEPEGEGSTGVMALITVMCGLNCETIV